MIDTIAYQVGHLNVVMRDEPDMIECMEANLHLAQCPCRTADSNEINNLADLFRGLN